MKTKILYYYNSKILIVNNLVCCVIIAKSEFDLILLKNIFKEEKP